MTERDFAEIINQTKGVVLSAIERHLADRFHHAIDDVAQEVYLRAYRSLIKNQFRGDAAISSWLYRIARNESLRMNRKLGREEEKAQKIQEEIDRINPTKEEEEYDVDHFRDMVRQLPEKYRSVMELLSQGRTVNQIAGMLQIRPGTVKSRSSRAREMLLKMYRSLEK